MAKKVLTCELCPEFSCTYVADLRHHNDYNPEHRERERARIKAHNEARDLEGKRAAAINLVRLSNLPLVNGWESFKTLDGVIEEALLRVIVRESDRLTEAKKDYVRALEQVQSEAGRSLNNIANGYSSHYLDSIQRRTTEAATLEALVGARATMLSGFCDALNVRTTALEPAAVTARFAAIAGFKVVKLGWEKPNGDTYLVINGTEEVSFANEGDAAIHAVALADALIAAAAAEVTL